MVQGVPGVRNLVWILSFVSFLFLYPSTFNLLEVLFLPTYLSQILVQVAAVDEPRLHLWETGITRITRHPQAFGQVIYWPFKFVY